MSANLKKSDTINTKMITTVVDPIVSLFLRLADILISLLIVKIL